MATSSDTSGGCVAMQSDTRRPCVHSMPPPVGRQLLVCGGRGRREVDGGRCVGRGGRRGRDGSGRREGLAKSRKFRARGRRRRLESFGVGRLQRDRPGLHPRSLLKLALASSCRASAHALPLPSLSPSIHALSCASDPAPRHLCFLPLHRRFRPCGPLGQDSCR